MPFGGLYTTIEADLGKNYLFTKGINDSAKEYALGQLNSTELKDYLNVTNVLTGNASCPKHYHSMCVCVIVWREVMFVYLLVVLPGYPSKDN
ncbi:hypothetical protein WR25_26700 [Diploscapter pachys]|uniref:Uncharacterized protein n=1 Tax=Diploscapter pachys TaxID=2018661 RepID=A0A2A2L8Z5_9BILA|nr:hypothetical protein WR25_26700 [Diploscapter pachys]